MPPRFVVIGGGTSSGKSTLCRELQAELGEQMMCLIHLDNYMKPGTTTHNQPKAIDEQRLYSDLERLRNGEAVEGPGGRTYTAQPLVVIEGHLALTLPGLLEQANLRVYIDMTAEERLLRRISRNVSGGGDLHEVVDWYRKDAMGNHWQFIEPSKQVADLILWGDITPRRLQVMADILRNLVRGTSGRTDTSSLPKKPQPKDNCRD